MPPKVRTLPIVEQWDCHGCTACCRETTIQLNSDDVVRLEAQEWDKRSEFHGVRVMRRSLLLGGAKVLAHKADGSCVFLTEAGRCRIHEEFGMDAKPFMCRQFPLQIVRTDRDAFATVVRSCPSAAADRGRALGEHLRFLKRLVGNEAAGVAAPPIVGRIRRGWDDFHCVAEAIERLLVEEQLPLVRRVAKCVRFCNLIEQCKWKRVQANAVAEIVHAAEELSEHELGELFRDREPPWKRAGRLFRRLAAHFIRCFPGGRPTRTIGDQWRVMRTAGRLARATSVLPELHPQFAAVEAERLERALGPLKVEIMRPLERFFVAHAFSRRYALEGSGCSLIDSARQLAFAFPMALWMLRWLAADRDPTPDDMVHIVVALERGLALPALNRATRYLAESGELERIIAWYAR